LAFVLLHVAVVVAAAVVAVAAADDEEVPSMSADASVPGGLNSNRLCVFSWTFESPSSWCWEAN